MAGTTVLLNQTVSQNPQFVSGGDFGVVVGVKPTETLGFYGVTGVAQQALPTDVAGVIDVLVKLGLVKAT